MLYFGMGVIFGIFGIGVTFGMLYFGMGVIFGILYFGMGVIFGIFGMGVIFGILYFGILIFGISIFGIFGMGAIFGISIFGTLNFGILNQSQFQKDLDCFWSAPMSLGVPPPVAVDTCSEHPAYASVG
jgi:hypothetical protein